MNIQHSNERYFIEFLPRSEVRQRLGVGDSMISYYLHKFNLHMHRFGGCKEGMLHQEAMNVLLARVKPRKCSQIESPGEP